MADRSNLYVVSLIALVAVVGIVTLFMNNAEAPVPIVVDEGGNIVGEASYKLPAKYRKGIEEPTPKFPVPQPDLPPPVCSELEKCGLPELKFVSDNEITKHYGDTDWTTTKDASQICSDLGYKGCFAGQKIIDKDLYVSRDGTCTNHQFSFESFALVTCDFRGWDDLGCVSSSGDSAIRSELGDYKYANLLTEVICIK